MRESFQKAIRAQSLGNRYARKRQGERKKRRNVKAVAIRFIFPPEPLAMNRTEPLARTARGKKREVCETDEEPRRWLHKTAGEIRRVVQVHLPLGHSRFRIGARANRAASVRIVDHFLDSARRRRRQVVFAACLLLSLPYRPFCSVARNPPSILPRGDTSSPPRMRCTQPGSLAATWMCT